MPNWINHDNDIMKYQGILLFIEQNIFVILLNNNKLILQSYTWIYGAERGSIINNCLLLTNNLLVPGN